MEPTPPYIDRLSAALKAVRQVYPDRRQNGLGESLGAKCLSVVISQLEEDGLPGTELKPLRDLEEALRPQDEVLTATPETPSERRSHGERRDGSAPSQTLLARLAAVIDLLVKGGYDESEAAQMVMRRLLAAGVPPPLQGGDARGWKRMLLWRADLSHGLATPEAKVEYREFTRFLDTIPAQDRIQRVLDEQLWDRRRNPR